MKVLLTGATGYIGSAIADKLQKSGYQVIGLARSDEAAQRLHQQGIRVCRGDLHDPQEIALAAREADAVIHTALVKGPEMPRLEKAFVEAMLPSLEGTGKPFLLTSGIWVIGDTGDQIADENSPLNPSPLVVWRPEIEQLVLSASQRGVRSVVIRPAIVYGRGGGVIGMLMQSARQNGCVRFIGTGENRWTLVHVDDLADLYVRAMEKAPAGTSLIAASDLIVRVREVAEALSQALGIPGQIEALPIEQARQTLGLYADALALDQQVSGAKAMELLGWKPKALSLFEDLRRLPATAVRC